MTTKRRKPAAAAKSASQQRGRPFPKGQSGNPAGRPAGSRHKTTLAVEALLEGESAQITRKCIALALAGDTTAMRLCMERIAPLRKGRAVELTLPSVTTAADVLTALGAVVAEMAKGEITPDEAAVVAGVIEMKRRAIETVEIEARVAEVEKRLEEKR